MNIKVNKTKGLAPDIQLNLTVRELELLTAWIGGAGGTEVARIINSCTSYGTLKRINIALTDRDEVDALWGYTAYKKFVDVLSDESILPDPILKTVEFVYDKGGGEIPKWRRIAVTVEDDYYIGGYDVYDNRQFKKFRKSNILGGRIITV